MRISCRCCCILLLLLLRPADPPHPKARNTAEDASKIPREAYMEEDIFHDNDDDDDDGNDDNNPPVSPLTSLRFREEDIE